LVEPPYSSYYDSRGGATNADTTESASETVVSPKRRLKYPHAIYAGNEWSLAVGLWDGNRAMLIRWNDDPDKPRGNPVSHGHPTWFVLPAEFHTEALKQAGTADAGRAEKAREWLNGCGPDKWPYDPSEFSNV
jgi:hypothetical protein